MLIGVGLAFLIELVDKTMKDERFIVETLELPVLGQVSEINPKELIRSRRIVVTAREDNKTTWEPQRSTRKRRRI